MDNGKGVSVGQFAIKKAVWTIIREITEEAHLQYDIVNMGTTSFCLLRIMLPVLITQLPQI